jgi:small-conductance mechanosensitive channel
VAAVAVAVVVALVLVALLRRLARAWGVSVLEGHLWRSPVVLSAVLLALAWVVGEADRPWSGTVGHVLQVGQIGAIAWLLVVLVRTMEKAALSHHPETGLRDERSRHIRTKIVLMQRVATAAIITCAVGVALWTIPQVRAVGATVLASAGVVSIIAGLAAQTTLANIFAGVQIAFTDGIRVGDIVVLEDVQGRIEEITLTYVAVAVWDGTRLILPCTYFTTTPFRNWSHSADSVVGQVRVACDWPAPIDTARAELRRVLAASSGWDGGQAELYVEDASGQWPVLLAQFTAAADEVEVLRFRVREALVGLLAGDAGSYPRIRHEPARTRRPGPRTGTDTDTDTDTEGA